MWRVRLLWNILLPKLKHMKNCNGEVMDTKERKAAASRILKIMNENSRYGVDSKTADRIANEAKHKSRKSVRSVRIALNQ